mmetsp:Transcript_27237/g.44690  ORF Transcript_27237/g.44690 Transcript_27237/m.44690 type:complete len:183 (+) Transcript_27237:156-704(+)
MVILLLLRTTTTATIKAPMTDLPLQLAVPNYHLLHSLRMMRALGNYWPLLFHQYYSIPATMPLLPILLQLLPWPYPARAIQAIHHVVQQRHYFNLLNQKLFQHPPPRNNATNAMIVAVVVITTTSSKTKRRKQRYSSGVWCAGQYEIEDCRGTVHPDSNEFTEEYRGVVAAATTIATLGATS